jgi:hypothetical protein
MRFEFNAFAIERVGELYSDTNFGWVTVSIYLTDSETNAHPNMQIEVPIPFKHDWTLDQIRQAAFEKAGQALEDASFLFKQYGLDGLQRLQDESQKVDE